MDRNEYRKRLEEFAIVKDRKPAKSPTHNRLAKETVIEIDELTGEEIEVEREITENPTLGFEVILKDRIAACELGCGDVVTNQVIERKLYLFPERHWRTRCTNCDHCVSPDGVGFIKNGSGIQSSFVAWFRKQNAKEIITNEGIIRKYE